MTQRYTVHLERVTVDRITVGVAAESLSHAREKAMDHIRAHPESWVSDPGAPMVKKIEAHASPPPIVDMMAPIEEHGPAIDWTQQDASQETVMQWMKANAKSYTLETLVYAAHNHFARPFHLDVMRKLAQRALSAGPG